MMTSFILFINDTPLKKMAVRDLSFEEILEERPTLAELCKNVYLGHKWYDLGMQLKLYPDKLDCIRILPGDFEYKTAKMFELWLDTDLYATRRQIIDALRSVAIENYVMADKYEETSRRLCGKCELCEFKKNAFN